MALINRVSRLFKADFHAVLDQIEEPEQILRQAVREMEDELAATQQRIAACAQEQEALGVRRQEIAAAAGEFDQQLDLCFESGKDELAKAIIRRKLEAERLLQRLDGKLEANARFLARQRKLLDENHATLDALRQKAELVVGRASPDDDGTGRADFARMARETRVGEDEVEIAFLREKATRSRP
jgi:phage shock protein A